ncbi:hypothetical protein A28LD_1747 [Idiomarina sp. A28L]|uniref:RodZ domain-containing protein n=1 Tax=Idiomarina sp. A28L TaxID=1036674 RepID=UPI00021385CC|nr:RodZ domain-containing protein [Idiomarina sp. A28L]EGN74731.1 hypothetical protein A28LD_1747 [Idiomarina sp. A28L]
MTNKNESDEDLQPEVVEELIGERPTPGELLRLGRENMGLSVGQVADRLRLRQQQIQELEDNIFTAHVSGTYIRGYLRSYAKLLHIDDVEILLAYEHLTGDEKPKGQMQSFSKKTSIETQDSRLMFFTWIIILILIGSVAVFVWQQFVEDREQANSSSIESSFEVADYSAETPTDYDSVEAEGLQPTDEQLGGVDSGVNTSNLGELSATTLAAGSEPAAGQVPGPSNQTTDSQAINAAGSSTPAQPPRENNRNANELVDNTNTNPIVGDVGSTTGTEIADTESADTESANSNRATNNPADQGELVLVFSGDSWIRIEDNSGEAIAYGVKESGYVMPLNGAAPYELTLGAPSVVAVYFRGEQIDLSEFRGGRIARFTLPRS